MADILNELNAAKMAAMKAKIGASAETKDAAELRLSVVRGILSEVERDSKEKKPRGAIAVLKSEHSKRVESAKIYGDAGQTVRSEREAAEAKVVSEFLPNEPTGEELQHFIADYIGANGLSGPKAMGEVMRVVREEFDNFDGKLASALTKQILAG
jgi:uncharacterized protein YqeY